MTTDIAKRAGQFVTLRDKIREIEERHKQELAPYKDALAKLSGVLLEHLNSVNGDSVKVRGVATVYRTTKETASLAEPEAFRRHVIGAQDWDLLDWKANLTGTREFLAQHGILPPGVNLTRVYTVGVRRDTAKD